MLKMLLVPTTLVVALATPTLAATTTNSSGPSSTTQGLSSNQTQGGNQATTPAIEQKLRSSLSQAGFTDVHIMPQSFLVRAKDKDGNPVMMIINPDSMTAVTALGSTPNTTNGQQTGSGAPAATSQNDQ